MKLVEILAKKLDVWPTGAAIAVQDGDAQKTVKFGSEHANPSIALMGLKDVWQAIDWKYTCQSDFDHSVLASDWKTAIVTKAQWQAERDRQKGGEWKRHRGGKPPVSLNTTVEVKLRCGDIYEGKAHELLWHHAYCDVAANIMQYRIISQPQAEEVELSRLEARMLFGKPCIVYPESTEAKTDQIDGPILWRDTVNELDAYIEEFTREREALINRLAEEGFALLPAMTAVMGVADRPATKIESYRDWKAGDIVIGKVDYNGQFTKGRQYKLTDVHVDRGRIDVEVDDKGEENGWTAHNFEFHSRP